MRVGCECDQRYCRMDPVGLERDSLVADHRDVDLVFVLLEVAVPGLVVEIEV